MGSSITFATLNYIVVGGGVGEGVGEGGEMCGSVSGGRNYGMHYLIKLTALIRGTRASSSSLSREGEIKGLFPNSSLPM